MRYHLIAITEDQRKSLVAAIEDSCDIGQTVEFLGAALVALDEAVPQELPEGLIYATMMPAELAYLETQLDDARRSVAHHRAKGVQLVADGFEVSGRYDLGMADRIEMSVAELEAQIEELKNG